MPLSPVGKQQIWEGWLRNRFGGAQHLAIGLFKVTPEGRWWIWGFTMLNLVGGTKCLGVHNLILRPWILLQIPWDQLVVFKDVPCCWLLKKRNKHHPHLLDRLKTTWKNIFKCCTGNTKYIQSTASMASMVRWWCFAYWQCSRRCLVAAKRHRSEKAGGREAAPNTPKKSLY